MVQTQGLGMAAQNKFFAGQRRFLIQQRNSACCLSTTSAEKMKAKANCTIAGHQRQNHEQAEDLTVKLDSGLGWLA